MDAEETSFETRVDFDGLAVPRTRSFSEVVDTAGHVGSQLYHG